MPIWKPRNVGAAPTAALLFLLIALGITACGGGSSDATPVSQPEVGDSAGSAPRVQLALNAPARTNLSVTTVSEQSVLVAGDTQQQTVRSTTSVAVSLEKLADSYKLQAIPELLSLSPDDLGFSSLPLYRIEHSLDSLGERSSSMQRRDIYDVLSLEAFALPGLNLSVPASPIGVGASWTESNSLPLFNSTTKTTVGAISAASITVSKQINVGTDEQERYTVSGSMEAVYSLPSLLIKSADIALSVRFEDELYINGVQQVVVDNQTFTQTIRETSE